MKIKRDMYLQRLIDRKENGAIKVITGVRRCGKSYLLFQLYREYLVNHGVGSSEIIEIPLDDDDFEPLRDRKELSSYIKGRISEKKQLTFFWTRFSSATDLKAC